MTILPEKTTFNVDNVRICKILGSGLLKSSVVQGMVFRRNIESNITKKENAKVSFSLTLYNDHVFDILNLKEKFLCLSVS